jgi:hypothetical protein
MRIAKGILLVLVVCACMGPLARRSEADSTTLNFNIATAGIPITPGTLGTLPGGGPPYGTLTLTLTTTDTGCSTDACIQVQGTIASGYFFYTQTGLALLGFDDSSASVSNPLTISNCVGLTAGSCGIFAPGSHGFDGLGFYQFAVTGTGATAQFGLASSSFEFDVQDPTAPFTSVTAIEAADSGPGTFAGLSEFASQACESNGAGTCQTTTGIATTGNPIHAYIGVTPEPASYLLFGSGLLLFGMLLRRKRAASV